MRHEWKFDEHRTNDLIFVEYYQIEAAAMIWNNKWLLFVFIDFLRSVYRAWPYVRFDS